MSRFTLTVLAITVPVAVTMLLVSAGVQLSGLASFAIGFVGALIIQIVGQKYVVA